MSAYILSEAEAEPLSERRIRHAVTCSGCPLQPDAGGEGGRRGGRRAEETALPLLTSFLRRCCFVNKGGDLDSKKEGWRANRGSRRKIFLEKVRAQIADVKIPQNQRQIKSLKRKNEKLD